YPEDYGVRLTASAAPPILWPKRHTFGAGDEHSLLAFCRSPFVSAPTHVCSPGAGASFGRSEGCLSGPACGQDGEQLERGWHDPESAQRAVRGGAMGAQAPVSAYSREGCGWPEDRWPGLLDDSNDRV